MSMIEMSKSHVEDDFRGSHMGDFPTERPSRSRARKRTRLNISESDDLGLNGSETSNQTTASSQPHNHYKAKSKPEGDSPRGKRKSKYRIHIPKNPEIPKDTFYTQPPQRSSPYRINEFCWQKPQRFPASPSARTNASASSSPHVSKSVTQVLDSDGERVSASCSSPEPAVGSKSIQKGSRDVVSNRNHNSDRHSQHPSQHEFDEALIQNYEDVLADIPSDAFSSSPTPPKITNVKPVIVSSQPEDTHSRPPPSHGQAIVAPLSNLRQTTLFGTQPQQIASQSQSTRKHNWPLANREEPPTHHKLNREALLTWVYPTNLGEIRDYQYSIVARGLYHNLLVALPTGLGKTFIAATIMLNWFRWTKDAQLVFVAPTKPLVSQQVKACFGIVGIPPSATTMLTGGTPPGVRAEEWLSKRVFFMTPQTIINDLKAGICDPKRIVLLVVDEAHRATGGYAYVEVVKFLNRFNSSFRVLALTATPGSSIESVQEVISGLGISRIEIRTEESLDIRQYVHSRKVDTMLFDCSEEMVMLMDLFAKALQPVLDKLCAMNAYWQKDPMTLTPYGCNQAQQKWNASDAGRKAHIGVKVMVNTIFSLLATLAHGIELLKFHGIGPFYHKIVGFRDEDGENARKGGKYRKQIVESMQFQTMMSRIQSWINKPDFVGHPKLDYLQSIVLRHFADAGDDRGASEKLGTRIMVFVHYRESAEEIARVLKRNEPMVRPHVFVGQASSKGSKGMDQKTQLEVIKKFQEGIYNTLVATSIGEEGLDIGEVDLIVCYDASASPIRMLQRMGRTGRKRAGNIVMTLMKGKEETNFIKAKDNYERMQKDIAAGTRFEYDHEHSRRIVPKDIQPIVDKKIIQIPPENSQADLPEPKKRGRPPKRPVKKFHMPDNVKTGFVKASRIEGDESSDVESLVSRSAVRKGAVTPEPIPSLDEIVLTAAETNELGRSYLQVGDDTPQIVDVPRLDVFPNLQRSLRPTKLIQHGRATVRFVKTVKSIHNTSKRDDSWYHVRLKSEDREEGLAQVAGRNTFLRGLEKGPVAKQAWISNSPSAFTSLDASPPKENGRFYAAGTCADFSSPRKRKKNNDFSDDEMTEDILGPSSMPYLSPLGTPSKQSSRKIYNVDSDSGEDLPDCDTLINKNAFTPASAVGCTTDRSGYHEKRQRKQKRRVIESDGDDE